MSSPQCVPVAGCLFYGWKLAAMNWDAWKDSCYNPSPLHVSFAWYARFGRNTIAYFNHSKQMTTAGYNKKHWLWPFSFQSLICYGGGCLILVKHVTLNGLTGWYVRGELIEAHLAKVGYFSNKLSFWLLFSYFRVFILSLTIFLRQNRGLTTHAVQDVTYSRLPVTSRDLAETEGKDSWWKLAKLVVMSWKRASSMQIVADCANWAELFAIIWLLLHVICFYFILISVCFFLATLYWVGNSENLWITHLSWFLCYTGYLSCMNFNTYNDIPAVSM